MAQFTGTVISINMNAQIKKRDGGTYPGYQLVYRSEDGQIRTLEKHHNSLKLTPSVAATLNALVEGDTFTCYTEKAGAFVNVISLAKGIGGEPEPIERATAQPAKEAPEVASTTVSARGQAMRTGKVVGSTYETPDERQIRRTADAVRQKLIIRQSCLAQAIQCAHSDDSEEIFKKAEEFEKWVMRGIDEIPH